VFQDQLGESETPLKIIAAPWIVDPSVALLPARTPANCGAGICSDLSNTFKDQLLLWAEFHQIEGHISVLVEPGMGFAGINNWWNPKTRWDSHKEPEHRGVDISCLVDSRNVASPIAPGAPLIWLASGSIVSIFNDLVGQTIVVEGFNRTELLFYVHTTPNTELSVDQTVSEGKLWGSIAAPIKTSNCSAHLHLGIARVLKSDSVDFRDITSFEKIEEFIRYRVIEFIDPVLALWGNNTSVNDTGARREPYVFLRGVRHACWPKIHIISENKSSGNELSRSISRTLPGVCRISVQQIESNDSGAKVEIDLAQENLLSITMQGSEVAIQGSCLDIPVFKSELNTESLLEYLKKLDRDLVGDFLRIHQKVKNLNNK